MDVTFTGSEIKMLQQTADDNISSISRMTHFVTYTVEFALTNNVTCYSMYLTGVMFLWWE